MRTLYVSDLDGTLLDDREEIPARTADILNGLLENGLLFSYATARSYQTAAKVTGGLNLKLPVICYNGAFLFDGKTGERLHSCGFTKPEAGAIQKSLEHYGLCPLVYSFVEGRERVSWRTDRESEEIRHYLGKRKGDRRLRPVSSQEDLYGGEPFYFTCIGKRKKLESAFEGLSRQAAFRVTFQKEIYREEYWLELMPREATKANGVLRLKKRLRCDRLVVFGDAENDISMFEAADAGYAVEQAVEALKKLASGLTPSAGQSGVARWLLAHGRLPE